MSPVSTRLVRLLNMVPYLKANPQITYAEAAADLGVTRKQLQQDLGNVEDKLAAARRFFNNAVGEFNAAIQAFPAVLFAPQMGFTQREFFDVGEETRKQIEVAPTVKF